MGISLGKGVDLTVPDKDVGPGKTIHIALGSLDIRNNYDGATFKDGAMKLKSLVHRTLQGFGIRQ